MKTLKIKCRSCGKIYKVEVLESEIKAYQEGELIQNAFPNLSPGERELIKTSICNSCWNRMFKE